MPAFVLARCSPLLRFLFARPEIQAQHPRFPKTHGVLLVLCLCGIAEPAPLGSWTVLVSALSSTGARRTDQKNGRLRVLRVHSCLGESRRSVGISQHACRQL